MATATARKVDDDDYAILSELAAKRGHSISEELRLMIAQYASKRRGELRVAELRSLREKHPIAHAPGDTAVSVIRAIRDE